jgi:hypothetical protein
MKQSQGRRVLMGTLLIAVLVVAAAAIFVLDDLVRRFEGRTTIVAVLPDAPGITRGAPVWIAGERVGRVRRVEFHSGRQGEAGRVAVELEIPERLRSQIGVDTYARITSARLIGEPVIDLVPGGDAADAGTDTVAGRVIVDRDALMEQAAFVRARFDSLAATLQALSGGSAWSDGGAARLQQRFAAVSREVRELRVASRGGSIALLLGDPDLRARVDSLFATAARIRAAFGEAGTGQRAQIGRVGSALNELAGRADSLSAAVGRLRTTQTQGTLGRFAADSALTVALRQLQVQLDSLVTEARRDPLRFVF